MHGRIQQLQAPRLSCGNHSPGLMSRAVSPRTGLSLSLALDVQFSTRKFHHLAYIGLYTAIYSMLLQMMSARWGMQIREKIVEGRLNKLKVEQALLEQAYIRSETNETVESILKQKVAEMGEKISIRRFVRYNLGEGLEKKSEDFAAEVAAQTEAMDAAPAAPEPPKVGPIRGRIR